MKKKYNIALTPLHSEASHAAIKWAQHFLHLADNYLLGKHSHPHVTLYQFVTYETAIDTTWTMICTAWQEKKLTLELNDISFFTRDNKTYSVSLIPNHHDLLHRLHKRIADQLQLSIKTTFDPHMTLFNTRSNEFKQEVDAIFSSYTPIVDDFVLTLGLSDDVGQMIEVIARYRDK